MNANDIVRCLCESGYEAYITGGAARDILLGQTPADNDIVTNARPDDIERLFKNQKVSNVGKSFNVCIVDGIDVASYRKDTYFGGSDKNVKIEFVNTLH